MNLDSSIKRIKQMMGLGFADNNSTVSDKSEEDRFTCSDCGNPDYRMYMVNDDIWNEFGNDRDTLCKSCLEKRMGRELTADDFLQHRHAPVNKHNPEVQSLM